MTTGNGIKELIKELKKIDGANVNINIVHKLYGDQNIKVALQLIDDEERLGFWANKQEIYVEKKRICHIRARDELWYFADEIMCIKIRKV